MRKGSYKILKRKFLVELLRSNFRFRSKISCSINTKLCHLVFRILDTKVFNYPLSPFFLYNTNNRCIPVWPLEYVNRLCNKHPISRCICKQTKPNKTNQTTTLQMEPVLFRICKRRRFKSFASPFQKHFDSELHREHLQLCQYA
jgi:hypothetical protein